MEKQNGKKKKRTGGLSGDGNAKLSRSPKAYDKDMEVFISISQELKDEGNKLFQKRDHEGAMLKYDKALKLLPRNHSDVSYLRSNMAACYMQMGLSEYPKAIDECNLALEVTPRYSKALLKRARCYEALNRLDLAFRDVTTVLNLEKNNAMAIEVAERVKQELESRGLRVNDTVIELPPDYVEPPLVSLAPKLVKEKTRKKKSKKLRQKAEDKIGDKKVDEKVEDKKIDENIVDKKAEDKVVVEEKISSTNEKEPKNTVKLVYGEDIRLAQLPHNCSLMQLREVISNRFPSSKAVLIKYRDGEGDLITITTDEELRWAEASAELQGSARLYIVDVNPGQDPLYERLEDRNAGIGMAAEKESFCIDNWIIEFVQLFKNHVGLDSDTYLNLYELGMKLSSEAMEDTVTSEEAQGLFSCAADKFQEMASLALFNWGNVHMSQARKRFNLSKDGSKESVLEQIKTAYDLAGQEYTKAGKRYDEALRIKPDFYEGLLALGQQQFEQAKLSWYYAMSSNVDLDTWPSTEVLQLYNSAEENMDKGMQMWEELERQRLSELSKRKEVDNLLLKAGLDGLFKDISADEAEDQASRIRSQINLLWGTILYERSIMEYKLGLPTWHECLEVAAEKFELAGASMTDVAVMLKNHCSNDHAVKGLDFKIDEIVQAWNEMYEAKKWQSKVQSFRLEPLLRLRVSKLYHVLEHA
ncbi:protein PHOX1-like isoform X2 [Mangifera indica]|uniref:protein PHOX1-like isoform X2 n=1 Tax=Mangifera indica TaxID=29780 RepID=UPI001CFB1CC5|nr:protein PHOX1-like isoform X2 [Mangifera indica]